MSEVASQADLSPETNLKLPFPIKAVSFDLDDTLWDCASAIARAEESLYAWLAEHAPRLTARLNAEELGRKRLDYMEAHPELWRDLSVLRRRFLTEELEQEGYPEHVAEQAFEVFYRVRSQVVLYDDALETLTRLSAAVPLAAITNGNANLEIAGIAHLFKDTRKASMTVAPKPAPDMFLSAANALGVAANEILHVGDNPEYDVHGANAAGLKTAWFNPEGKVYPTDFLPPDVQIQRLADLPALVIP